MEASVAPVPVRLVHPVPPTGQSVTAAEASAPAETVAEGLRLEPVEIAIPVYRVSAATLAALATVAGVAAVVLGAWAFVSSVREPEKVEVLRAAPIAGSAQAISLLSKPSTQRLPLRNSAGALTLAVGAGGRGVLVLDGLAIAPVGLMYQAWVLDPRKRPYAPIAAAAFTGVETAVPLSARVPPGWFLGITVEKTFGAAEPSQEFRYGVQRAAAGR
jgi:hypothetical protein